jgi:radical SAM protein with 4Fe4S-binding SPASM domain
MASGNIRRLLKTVTQNTPLKKLAELLPGAKPERAPSLPQVIEVRAPFALHNIELTNRCPMRCVMCPRTEHMTRQEGVMEFELFSKIIEEMVATDPHTAKTNGVWMHHFGESLVHPEFGKFMGFAADRGVRAKLSINPIMLTDDNANELLDARPALLYLSLDGHDDASFEKLRGLPHGYEKSKANVLKFLELKTKKKSNTFITVSMIDFDLNKPSIARMREFWESQPGVNEFLIKQFESFDGSASEINALRPDGHPDFGPTRKVVCDKPWKTMTVTWTGDVVPCCFDFDAKYILGNLRDNTLSEIWNGEPMLALRREFLSGTLHNSLCANCEVAYAKA